MWELDYKEGWTPKNWCFQTVVLEKTLECPLDCKEIQPVNPKGNQPCIFIGKTAAEAEAPVLWLPDVKSPLIGKALGKIEGRRRRGWQRTRWLGGITNWMDMNLNKVWEMVKDREAWHSAVHAVAELDKTEQLNWIILHCMGMPHFIYSSINGRLGYFYLLAIVNKAAMKVAV